MLRIWLVGLLSLSLVPLVSQAAQAQPRVEMELATEPGFPITGAQKWLKLLTAAGVDGVQIRSRTPSDEPRTTQRGTPASPSYHVLGILTVGDRLLVEGASFSSQESGKIKAFLETLRSEGVAGTTEKKGAFGLTEREMAEVLRDLSRPVPFATKGQPPGRLVEKLKLELQLPLAVEPAAATRLAEADAAAEELRGMSAGTALAVLLRPGGVVLQAGKSPAGLQHAVVVSRPQMESWPVGFQPQQPDRELLPVLFEFLTVEIDGIQLDRALAALEERLNVPMLLDHNALARHGIDPEKVAVRVPEVRSYYKKILDRLLFQAKLKGELRVDEADKPFLWITTIKEGGG